MIAYSVNVPEYRKLFFQEFLETIGAKYEEVQEKEFCLSTQQKHILDSQDNIPLSEYVLADDFIKELKQEYAL